jgi:hypothetical protein
MAYDFLCQVEKKLAIVLGRLGLPAAKLFETKSFFTGVFPSYVVRRCAEEFVRKG